MSVLYLIAPSSTIAAPGLSNVVPFGITSDVNPSTFATLPTAGERTRSLVPKDVNLPALVIFVRSLTLSSLVVFIAPDVVTSPVTLLTSITPTVKLESTVIDVAEISKLVELI